MKKTYLTPATKIVHIMGDCVLIGNSIPINQQAVSDSNDIGFTKEDNGGWSDIWDE